ncbi:uncharacterized protein LOC133785041 [Humulus lupulus]|uniref:uncharacterized protein LOC133785041 n=1 Tax=Humulus lupulus TaxID=3486 RepID=UPI002B40398C|nr:uncharacterized protein LOC133785041 [Humulus lupulus]
MRKKQLPHTCSRRGYARTMDDMSRESSKPVTRVQAFLKTHTKKNGEPVNAQAAEVIEKLQVLANEKPDSCTTQNTVQDALTIIFGPDKNGRSLANGRGVTNTKLAILRARDDHISQLESSQSEMKNKMSEMMNLINTIAKSVNIQGFTQPSEAESHMPSPMWRNCCRRSMVF